jgi:hypothetical protein
MGLSLWGPLRYNASLCGGSCKRKVLRRIGKRLAGESNARHQDTVLNHGREASLESTVAKGTWAL